MKAVLKTEEATIKRASSSPSETAARIYLPKSWAGRLVVIIPISFSGETVDIQTDTETDTGADIDADPKK